MNPTRLLTTFLLAICLPLVSFGQTKPLPVPAALQPARIEEFKIKTTSPENPEVSFYLRIPAGFDASIPGKHRLLYVAPIVNNDGKVAITHSKCVRAADARGWFIMSGTFRQVKTEAQDRKKSYYYPEGFSGKAVLDAMEQMQRKYPIDTERMFLQGLSGGAQFTHRFALWAPERVVAAAINSCSWFDEPNAKSNLVAWLVTIGESDRSYDNSLRFLDQLRDRQAAPIFRSYLGMIHEDDPRVDDLDVAFLKFYDDLTKDQLGKKRTLVESQNPSPALQGKDMPYIGDSLNWKYLPNTEDNRDEIAEDTRIYLPSEVFAKMWGKVGGE